MNGEIKKIATRIFTEEANAIKNLVNLLTEDFEQAIQSILNCPGHSIVTGLGKSGLIGKKIAATLASTGTPAVFMHPTEAFHGDLGMIKSTDIIIAITNSGETDEILRLIPFFKHNGNKIIAITGNPSSTLAKNADYKLNIHVKKEACPLNLAPTTSAATTLVMGDALAITLMEIRHFKSEDYAKFHPGGSLGRKLLTRVGDVMRTDDLPFVAESISNVDLLVKMSEGKLGMALIGSSENLKGIITDGDLRRGLIKYGSLNDFKLSEHLTRNPVTVDQNISVQKVEELMKEKKISTVIVKNSFKVKGVYQIYS